MNELDLAKKIRKLVLDAFRNRHEDAVWQENPHEYFALVDARVAEEIRRELTER